LAWGRVGGKIHSEEETSLHLARLSSLSHQIFRLHLLVKVRLPLEALQHLRLELSHLLIQLG
jgi:hypothetical protein